MEENRFDGNSKADEKQKQMSLKKVKWRPKYEEKWRKRNGKVKEVCRFNERK